jgi:hypothetical protein
MVTNGNIKEKNRLKTVVTNGKHHGLYMQPQPFFLPFTKSYGTILLHPPKGGYDSNPQRRVKEKIKDKRKEFFIFIRFFIFLPVFAQKYQRQQFEISLNVCKQPDNKKSDVSHDTTKIQAKYNFCATRFNEIRLYLQKWSLSALKKQQCIYFHPFFAKKARKKCHTTSFKVENLTGGYMLQSAAKNTQKQTPPKKLIYLHFSCIFCGTITVPTNNNIFN